MLHSSEVSGAVGTVLRLRGQGTLSGTDVMQRMKTHSGTSGKYIYGCVWTFSLDHVMPLSLPVSLGLDLKNLRLQPLPNSTTEGWELGLGTRWTSFNAEPLSGWVTMDKSLTFTGLTFLGCKWGNNSASIVGLFWGSNEARSVLFVAWFLLLLFLKLQRRVLDLRSLNCLPAVVLIKTDWVLLQPF